jgi:endonuclease/exonuclease/phosphatase family metal-dependent hydrolase
MTYNVHDLRDDQAAAARVVRAVQPDVLCLQEVPRRLTTELRVPRFARACRMRWGGGRLGTGGTAVLTGPRVHVRETFRGRLPVSFPDRSRGYAAATVSLRGAGAESAPVTVVSVHLGLRADERVRHVSTVLDRLASAADGLGTRVVVAGDLNEGADGRAHAVLAGRYRLVSAGVPTFPSDRPTAALDVVFATPTLSVLEPGAMAVDERDLVAGSDHRPVWVDLEAGASNVSS